MIELDDDAYHALSEKARAWDNYVHNRLTDGFTRGETIVECIQGETILAVHDLVIITPFGKAQLNDYPDGKRQFNLRPGDHIKLGYEIKLSIS